MPDYTAALQTPLLRESLRLLLEEELPLIALQEAALLSVVPKRTAVQKQIKDSVNVGGRVAQRRAVTADRLRTGASSATVPFTLPIGDHAITNTIQVLKTDAIQAANTAPAELANLFRYQVQDCLRVTMRDLNSLLYSGDGTAGNAGVIGLDEILTSVGYAGITNALWAGIDDATAGALNESHFLTMERKIAEAEAAYNLIVMSPAAIQTYKTLFAANRVFQVANGTNPADFGVSNVTYNGRQIIQDNQCPANEIYFLNTNNVALYTFNTGSSAAIDGLQVDINEVQTVNPYLMEFELGVIPQLSAKNRKGVNRLTITAS